MEKLFEELYLKDDPISGESDYYLDGLLTKPYDGIVIDKVNDIVLWKFDVRKGKRTGLEYVYNIEGKLEQVNECRSNLMFGVSKEYDESGNIITASVVYNNNHLKVIEVNRNLHEYNVIDYREKRHENGLPTYIEYLLNLSNEELINYEFQTDNPNLILS